MSLRALRTLISIARKGSFASAAAEMNLTQAAVSLQMKGLEEELETELFDRSGRSPKLNANGRLALERAEEIIALYDGLPEELNPREKVRGVLVLGVIRTALTGPVPRVLSRLHKEYDQLEVRIRFGLSAEVAKRVEEGELDAGLISEPPYAPPPHIEWRPYDVEPFYIVAPPDTPYTDEASLFEHLPYIRFAKTVWSGAIIEGHLMAAGIKPMDILEMDSVEAALSMVEMGLGVAVIPFNAMGIASARERFTLMPLGEPQLDRKVGLYQNLRHPRRSLTEPLFQALVEECKPNKS